MKSYFGDRKAYQELSLNLRQGRPGYTVMVRILKWRIAILQYRSEPETICSHTLYQY